MLHEFVLASHLVAQNCVEPNREASVVKVVAPVFPDAARRAGVTEGNALVRVDIAGDGAVSDASVYRSSGNADLDEAALTAARASTYSGKVVNCTPREGIYLFRAVFVESAWNRAPAIARFEPPAGYNLMSGDSTRRVWKGRGPDGFALLAQANVNDVRAFVRSELTEAHVTAPVLDRAETLCNGTVDGWHQSFVTTGGMLVDTVAFVQGTTAYVLSYFSRGAEPTDTVTAALLSVCPP